MEKTKYYDELDDIVNLKEFEVKFKFHDINVSKKVLEAMIEKLKEKMEDEIVKYVSIDLIK